MSGMTLRLDDLARLVGGVLVGDSETLIGAVAPIEIAAAGDITFVANPKYLGKLSECRASAVIVTPGVDTAELPRIETENPYLAFAKILTRLKVQSAEPLGIMAGAFVDPDARIGEGVTLYPGCFVGAGAQIGDGSILHPGVTIYPGAKIGRDVILHAGSVVREHCVLGDRVILQPSAVIGSDGFGYAPDGQGYYKIPQVGIVVLEDDVEVGSCSCVDRGTMSETRISQGTKIDNLVQVGHNVQLGEHSILVSQSGIAGSTRIGRRCTLGGQSAVSGHLKLGDNVTIAGRGGVTKDVASNQVMSGIPAIPHKDWLKASMSFSKLPEFRKELKEMKNKMARLEALLKERNEDGSQ